MNYQIHVPTLDIILSHKALALVLQNINAFFHAKLISPLACANADYLSFLPHVEVVENHAALIAACPALFTDPEFKNFLKAGILGTIPYGDAQGEADKALDAAFATQQKGNSLNTFHSFCRLLGDYLPGDQTVVKAINTFICIQARQSTTTSPIGNPAAHSFHPSSQPQENKMRFLVHVPTLNIILDNRSTTPQNQEINRLFKERLVQARLPHSGDAEHVDYYSCLPHVRVTENHAALLTACPALRDSNEFEMFLKTEVAKRLDNPADKSNAYNTISFMLSAVNCDPRGTVVFDDFCHLLNTPVCGERLGQLISPFIMREAFKPNPIYSFPHSLQQPQNWPAPPNGAFPLGSPFHNSFFQQPGFTPPQPAPAGFIVPVDQRKVAQLEKEVAQLKEQLGSLERTVAALAPSTKCDGKIEEAVNITPENPVDVIMQSEFHILKERLLKMQKHAYKTITGFGTSSAVIDLLSIVNRQITSDTPPSHDKIVKALDSMDW